MKELIKTLRLGASISRERNMNLDYAIVADRAADAIERLDNEAVAATLRIENDTREIAELQMVVASGHKYIEENASQRVVMAQAQAALAPFANDAKGIHEDWADERNRNSLTQDKPLIVGDFRKALYAMKMLEAAKETK